MDSTKLKDFKIKLDECVKFVHDAFEEGPDQDPISYKTDLATVREGLHTAQTVAQTCIDAQVNDENVKAEAAKKAAEEQAAADAEGDNQAE